MGLLSNVELNNTTYGIRSTAIPYGEVDSTSTSTAYTATIPEIKELSNGICMFLKNGVVTSASSFTININNLGAKHSYNNMATGYEGTAPTRDTTIFDVNYTMFFVYSEDIVDGGGWICYRGYDANTNTIGYQLRTNSTVMVTSDASRYYKIYFTSADGTKWVPAAASTTNSATSAKTVNQRPINPFGRIVYMSATTNFAAGANLTATAIWDQYNVTLGYSFNRTGAALTLTTKTPVYIKCAPQSDGSAIIDADTPYVQALPSTADGKIYIFLGVATSATQVEIVINHPIYYYKDGAIRLWTNAADSGVTSITAGTGLSGGTITSTGTIALDTTRALTTSDITTGTATDNKLVSAKTIHDALSGGTVTSVQVRATSPVQSSSSGAQTSTLSTTISLADGYGDIKNPYKTKPINTVLAGGTEETTVYTDYLMTDLDNRKTATYTVATVSLPAGNYSFSADVYRQIGGTRNARVDVTYGGNTYQGNSVGATSSVAINGKTSYRDFSLTATTSVQLKLYGSSSLGLLTVPIDFKNITLNSGAPFFRKLVAEDIPYLGNITNMGDITSTSTIASGDRLVINDESESKITNSSITFGTSTTRFLANNGTWQTPASGVTDVKVNGSSVVSDGVASVSVPTVTSSTVLNLLSSTSTVSKLVTGASGTSSITPVTSKTVVTSTSYSNGILTINTGASVTNGTSVNVVTGLNDINVTKTSASSVIVS